MVRLPARLRNVWLVAEGWQVGTEGEGVFVDEHTYSEEWQNERFDGG